MINILIVLIVLFISAGCSKNERNIDSESFHPGALPIAEIKIGLPESEFKNAILSFFLDPKGTFDKQTQYLSRAKDAWGGQYVVQCMDSRCYRIFVYHFDSPVSKRVALKTIKQILPENIDSSSITTKADNETLDFGNKYKAELLFSDNTHAKVKSIGVSLSDAS